MFSPPPPHTTFYAIIHYCIEVLGVKCPWLEMKFCTAQRLNTSLIELKPVQFILCHWKCKNFLGIFLQCVMYLTFFSHHFEFKWLFCYFELNCNAYFECRSGNIRILNHQNHSYLIFLYLLFLLQFILRP